MSSHKFKLSISPTGNAVAIYDDRLAEFFNELGTPKTRRASHVEPAADGTGWTADMSPMGGPILGPFHLRSEALAAEITWLDGAIF